MIRVSNPILPGCHPDPSVCRVGDEYFLVTSTFEYLPGLPVMRSTDLVHWETIGHAIDRSGMLDFDGLRSSSGLYAPTIRHDGERFWIVCTLVDQSGSIPGGNFVITAENAAGPWSDPIMLDADGIDPSVAFDEDGRVWMHGTRLAREPEWFHQTEIWVREYSPSEQRLVGEETVIWRGALNGAVWAEAPHLYRLHGRWYLIAAEAGTEFHHAVSVARADAVTGPYEGSRANPVFTHRHLGRGVDVIGAGHADLVQAPDGSWVAVMLAMRADDGAHYPLGRETFLCPVVWEDDWPVFAPGVGRLPETIDIPWADAAAPAQSWQPDARTAGPVPPHDARWTSPRALPAAVASIESHSGASVWRLPVTAASLTDATASGFLGIRQQHPAADATVDLDVSELAAGETAGLVLRQSERDHALVQVTRTADGLQLQAVHRRTDAPAVLAEQTISAADTVRLAVHARGYEYALVANGDTLAIVAGRALAAPPPGGFRALGGGVSPTPHGARPRGSVRIDAFDYAPWGAASHLPIA